jgi:hypothetical protein
MECISGDVKITRFIRRLHGSSQSWLAVGSDFANYVVKFNSNPQGQNLLFNEAFGSELYRAVGLLTAGWCPIQVDDESLDRNPQVWFEVPNGTRRPDSGLHFGSRFVENASQITYDIIPKSWFNRIENRDQFWGALVLDIWAEHVDHRQAVFTRNGSRGTLTAHFIDHGHMFGGPSGSKTRRPFSSMFLDLDMYSLDRTEVTVGEWVEKVRTLKPEILFEAFASVPHQWRSSSTKSICERLLRSRELLEASVTKEIVRIYRNSFASRGEPLRLREAHSYLCA